MVLQQVEAAGHMQWRSRRLEQQNRCSGAAASGRIEMAQWCCNKWKQQHRCSAAAAGGIIRAYAITVVNSVAGEATEMIQ